MDDINRWTVDQLKSELRLRGYPVSGNKKELFEIYPELVDNVVWLKGLIAQQKTILKYLKVSSKTLEKQEEKTL